MDFESIKQRKVVQWTIGYGLLALPALGFFDSIAAPWDVSLLWQRRIQVGLLMGFPLAALLSWFHGEAGRQKVGAREIFALSLWSLVTIAVVASVPAPVSDEVADAPGVPAQPWEREGRIAFSVQPFEDLSSDGSLGSVPRVVADEVRGRLAAVSGLRVLAPESGRIAQDLAEVRYLLTGSVRGTEEVIAVAVELQERVGQTLELQWRDQIEEASMGRSLFEMERDVALQVAELVSARMSEAERERVVRAPTQSEEALRLYQQAQRLSPQASESENMAAGALLQAALQSDPSFASAKAMLGMVYSWRSRFPWGAPMTADSGLALVRQAVRDDPENPDALTGLAFTLYPKGHFSEARRADQQLMLVRPSGSFSFRNLGAIEHDSGNLASAVNYLAEALRLWPEDATSMLYLGRTYTALGEHAVATEWFDRMRRNMPPQLQWFMINQANNLVMAGDLDAASALVESLLVDHPDNPMLHLNRALMALRRDDVPAAVEAMETFSEMDPTIDVSRGWTAEVVRGLVLTRAGRLSEAESELAAAEARALEKLQNGDERYAPRLELARVEALRGNTDEAVRWAEEAVETGWRAAPTLLGLEAIQDHPDFVALLARTARLVDGHLRDLERRQTAPDPSRY